jgi:hypothetical protein
MSMENTDRREYLGINTSLEVKEALKTEAKKLNKSVSFLTHSILVKELRKRGYTDCIEGISNVEYRETR